MRAGPGDDMIEACKTRLESVGSQPATLALPVTLIDRPSGLRIPNDASRSSPALAPQSSIGQFIFLESIESERI